MILVHYQQDHLTNMFDECDNITKIRENDHFIAILKIRTSNNRCKIISITLQGWGQVQLTKYSSTPSTPNIYQGWGQVQLTKYSSTPSTPNIYQVQVLVKYSFF